MKLKMDFNALPDKVPSIPSGIYEAPVTGIEQAMNKKETGYNLVVEFTLGQESGELAGRKIKDWIPISTPDFPNNANQFSEVKLKRFLRSANADLSGDELELNDLLGSIVKFTVSCEVSNDEVSGEVIERSSVQKYIIPD